MMISIHAPRMGSDRADSLACSYRRDFNPRSPDGERRSFVPPPCGADRYFNPRSPDGERQCGHFCGGHRAVISIHAPRMGSDYKEPADTLILEISIHAPRMGSDITADPRTKLTVQFQSTLPGWGATLNGSEAMLRVIFQSTLPGWGATIA